MDVPDADVERILTSLGFCNGPSLKPRALPTGWDVTPPAWRVDMHRQVDLIEEIGRHYGFEHLPATFPGVEQAPPPSDPRIARDRRMRTALLGMGFSEAITFAFIEAMAAEPFLEGEAPVALANPLSEKFAVMRPSLLPGLIDAVSHNRRHGRPRRAPLRNRHALLAQRRDPRRRPSRGPVSRPPITGAARVATVDFFDIKGVVEQLAALASVCASVRRGRHAVPGQPDAPPPSSINGTAGRRLRPARARDRRPRATCRPATMSTSRKSTSTLLTAASPIETLRATTLPRYPSVVRDISILVDDTLSAETVRGTIRSAAPDTLIQVREFDRYQGKGIPDGKVSLSFRLTFQSPERTLTDDEVQAGMQHIIDALTRDLQAVQR